MVRLHFGQASQLPTVAQNAIWRTELSESSGPRSITEIASYHAHIYYDPATTRGEAERLRGWIDERFAVTLGRWHDVKVGPHDQAMFQVAFAADVFRMLVPWDHLLNPIWMGSPVAVVDAVSWQLKRFGAPEHEQSSWAKIVGRRRGRTA